MTTASEALLLLSVAAGRELQSERDAKKSFRVNPERVLARVRVDETDAEVDGAAQDRDSLSDNSRDHRELLA